MADSEDLEALAAEAFVYSFPLVFDLQEVERFSPGGYGQCCRGAVQLVQSCEPSSRAQGDRFVSINNDTVYSIAQLDVSGGPVRLEVPDTRAATTCCSSSMPGRTTSPTSANARPAPRPAHTCLSRRAGTEQPAEGETVIRLPTAVATILGRWAVNGEKDMAAVPRAAGAADAHPDERWRRWTAGPGRRGRRRPACVRADAGLDAGLSPGRARHRVPAAIRTTRSTRPDFAVRLPRPSALQPPLKERPGGGAQAHGGCAQARGKPRSQRLEADLPRVRLQPRLLRDRRARRSPLEDRRIPSSATSSAH